MFINQQQEKKSERLSKKIKLDGEFFGHNRIRIQIVYFKTCIPISQTFNMYQQKKILYK